MVRGVHRISKMQKCQQSHTFLATQIRNVVRKWHPTSTMFILTSKTKRPKLRSLLANQDDTGPVQKTQWRSSTSAIEKFGDLITADHRVLTEGGDSRDNHRYAVVVQDLATQWIQSSPCKRKTSQETERSIRKFLERRKSRKSFAGVWQIT